MADLKASELERDEIRVAATLENVRRISDFVRAAGRRLGWAEDVAHDIDLAVEEASTNVVRHAYGSEGAGDMAVRLEATDETVRITLTDWGKPFDADSTYLGVDASLEARAEGGMGLLLVHRLMDSVIRTPALTPGGPNVLLLVKRVAR